MKKAILGVIAIIIVTLTLTLSVSAEAPSWEELYWMARDAYTELEAQASTLQHEYVALQSKNEALQSENETLDLINRAQPEYDENGVLIGVDYEYAVSRTLIRLADGTYAHQFHEGRAIHLHDIRLAGVTPEYCDEYVQLAWKDAVMAGTSDGGKTIFGVSRADARLLKVCDLETGFSLTEVEKTGRFGDQDEIDQLDIVVVENPEAELGYDFFYCPVYWEVKVTPEAPKAPVVPEAPKAPVVPETPKTPVVPETPKAPEIPETPSYDYNPPVITDPEDFEEEEEQEQVQGYEATTVIFTVSVEETEEEIEEEEEQEQGYESTLVVFTVSVEDEEEFVEEETIYEANHVDVDEYEASHVDMSVVIDGENDYEANNVYEANKVDIDEYEAEKVEFTVTIEEDFEEVETIYEATNTDEVYEASFQG